ncbi:lipopolysaccharide biosynthesis protein [Aeromonas caviae]|uniref:lipopolysaccharide biosynthesis protein n=1 Tax=Aeromonas caviae TaxID=648 RepID=UPI003F744A6C
MTSINQQLKKAIGLSLLGRYSAYIVQLALLMLYARWFSPEEFGVLAAIQVFVIFFMMLAEIGLGPALINQRQLSEKDRNGLFSLTWLIGIGIAIVFYIVTYGLNNFYGRDDYHLLGLPICVSILFSAANTLPMAFLQREKRFITLARSDVLAELPALIIVWWVLESGSPLYALAVRPLVVAIAKFVLNYIACAKTEFSRPMFGYHLAAIKPLLGFSGYQFAFNFINYFSRNLDNILVGRMLGMGALGVYDKAYALMKYPLQLLTFAITPAIQPVLAQHAHDLELMERTHTNFVRKISVLGVLAGVFMGASSNEIVFILLGEQWKSVVPVLQVLSIIIPVQVIMSTSGGFYQALNRTDLLFRCGVFSAITNVIAIIIGIWLGSLEKLAWCLIISFHINFFQCYWIMYRYGFGFKYLRFLKSILPATLIQVPGLIIFLFLYITNECGVCSF